VFQPGDQTVQTVTAVGFLQRVHLVDDDGADPSQVTAGPQRVVDSLVGADDHVRGGVEGGATPPHPGGANADRHVHQVAVAFLKGLVFLVRQCDKRHQKQRLALSSQRAVQSGHLADQRLPRRGGAHDELVRRRVREQVALDGETLYGQQFVEPRLQQVLQVGVEVQIRSGHRLDVLDGRTYFVELREVGVQIAA
jgi:hypothetical protein